MAVAFHKGPLALAGVLAALSALPMPSDAAPRSRAYIVQLADAPAASYRGGVAGLAATRVPEGRRLKARDAAVQKYVGHLERQRSAVLAQLGSPVKVLHRYNYSYSGFSAVLTEAQARKLARLPGVAAVTLDTPRELDTNHTPSFLGLDKPGGVWSMTRKGTPVLGEDVIVGIIDGGFQPENSSFYDRVDANGKPVNSGGTLAYGPAPAGWSGSCVAGPAFDPAKHCNNKVIGARAFDASFKASGVPVAWYEFPGSPRDVTGHGTHTSSTAAGNQGADAVSRTQSLGPISGIAPRARIAHYKVCWSYREALSFPNNCWTADSVAAIDQAVADGVDVINYSISGSQTDLLDPVEVAFLHAAEAGVFVAASAGNSGPVTAVAHNSPWLTTVAASTHDRFLMADTLMGNGNRYRGASQSKGLPSTSLILSTDAAAGTVEDARLCKIGSLKPEKVAGKIVVCDRGTYARVDKSLEVLQAGGIGMIMLNTPAGLPGGGSNTLNDDSHWVPSVHLPVADRDAVRAYAQESKAKADMGVAALEPGVIAPVMADFSSRGPNMATPSVMKPDITAPGVAILAAVAAAQPNQAFHDGLLDGSIVAEPIAEYFDGTSMSSPHIAGMAALIKQKHPNYWGPASIKSALMTSATPVLLATGAQDTAFKGYGAGHANPNGALDAGLLYPLDPTDYWRYLCGQGLLSASSPTCTANGSIAGSELNLASFSADVPGIVTFKRTVRNLGNRTVTYNASISVDGYTAVVSPATLTLEKGQKGRFEVTLTANGAPLGQWNQGSLVWSDGTHAVRSPIMARLVNLTGPTNLASQSSSDTLRLPYQFGYTGALSHQVSGLLPATRSASSVGRATVRDGDEACKANAAGTVKFPFTAPTGTMAARFALFNTDTAGGSDDDLDLYVYDAANTLVGSSGSSTSEERVTLMAPAAGNYVACVHGYAPADGVSTTFTLSSWVVSPDATSSVPLKVRGLPDNVVLGGEAKVRMSWSGAVAGERYLGAVRLAQGADASTAPTLGVTMLAVEPGAVQSTRGLPLSAKAALQRRR